MNRRLRIFLSSRYSKWLRSAARSWARSRGESSALGSRPGAAFENRRAASSAAALSGRTPATRGAHSVQTTPPSGGENPPGERATSAPHCAHADNSGSKPDRLSRLSSNTRARRSKSSLTDASPLRGGG